MTEAKFDKVRAKFMVQFVQDYGTWQKVALSAQYSSSKEDNQFAAATPSGTLEMTISNPAVFGFLKPGKQYYLEFTEAPTQ